MGKMEGCGSGSGAVFARKIYSAREAHAVRREEVPRRPRAQRALPRPHQLRVQVWVPSLKKTN